MCLGVFQRVEAVVERSVGVRFSVICQGSPGMSGFVMLSSVGLW